MVTPEGGTSDRRELTPPELMEVMLEPIPAFGVDWQTPALEMDEASRLMRLARVKAILPEGNVDDEKNVHDATLENYTRLALQAAGDQRTIATFLDHVQNVLELNPAGARLLAQQVFWVWSPAAEVAGLYNHKEALEEEAFKVLLPDEYDQTLAEYDKAQLEGSGGLLERVVGQVNQLLTESLDGGVGFQLSARPKSNYSVWRKMRSEKRQDAQIFDLLGLRVVIDGEESLSNQQCYAAMTALAEKFESDKSRLKDYIVDPKATGYQSIHLTLYTDTGFPFELQIRTRRMHEFAESDGALSHQTYDATFKQTPGKSLTTYRKVPRLYRWRNQATAFMRENNDETEGILGDDILFFRPDGNLYKTSRGANILDASFRIHSRRALRTKEIAVNGKPTQLNSALHHGDLVDVEYWLTYPTDAGRFVTYSQMVSTKYARDAVAKGRRQAMRAEYRQLGRGIVLELVGQVGMSDPFTVLDEKDRRDLADSMGLVNFDNYLEIIGAGVENSKPSRIARWIKERLGVGSEVVMKASPESLGTLSDYEVIQKLDIPSIGGDLECQIAGCCSQRVKYGDSVFVRPSRLDGVLKVHLTECVNVRERTDTIECGWS